MKRVICAAAALAVAVGTVRSANAEAIYGLTNLQQLVTFDSVTRTVTSTVSPAGFSIVGDFLLSIDVRPATGELYGLSNQGGIFKLNPVTGASTQVGGFLSPAPTGNLRSIDFNPTVDRIRLLTSSGTNLRIHPATAAIAFTDSSLAFAAGDPNVGDTPEVVNGAYTNSFPGAVTTTLYDIDANNDVLVTQAPPNNGTLNTVGAIGSNIAPSAGFTGFDISGATGTAYLVGNNLLGGLTPNTLYQVNLGTGAASVLGAVSGVNGSFRDIAVATVVPEPASLTLLVAAACFGIAARRRRR
jgi:hypothetical protein